MTLKSLTQKELAYLALLGLILVATPAVPILLGFIKLIIQVVGALLLIYAGWKLIPPMLTKRSKTVPPS